MGAFSAWAVAIGVITYRDVKAGRAPLPSEFVASGAVFAALAALDQAAHPLGGALAWGFLLAIFLQVGPKALVGTPNPAAPGGGAQHGKGAIQ